MSYYRALQIKGLQSYKPSKFAKTRYGPQASMSIVILAESDPAILIIFDLELWRPITLFLLGSTRYAGTS